MKIKIVDPAFCADWNSLIKHHFDPDIFHTREWCQVLKLTYNLNPLYFAIYDEQKPTAIIPLIEINSLITGKRVVSLPFSDFCHPLIKEPDQLEEPVKGIINYGVTQKCKYVEFRSSIFFFPGKPSETYYTHNIDLSKPSTDLWSSLRDSNRRNIKKAMRYGLKVRFEKSPEAMRNFYRLQVITRKRHGIPPQPFKFFRNIYDEMIAKNLGIIASAYYRDRMIAASIFLHFNRKALFKFGASDHTFHHLRPNNLIMWESINWHQENGCYTLSLGRTDPEDQGLLSYKRSWGSVESKLCYYRIVLARGIKLNFIQARKRNLFKKIFQIMPPSLLRLAGTIAYKHLE
ncbi:MAG: GNAT family N-acetyltransferase [Candidatus Saccharicenans sp.]|nr:GNAT family N-acetyltransferase [Candidatus Saccharicenans sp.]MDI6848916.1 GNAT family N-acetyltransferase [Candidatus Saccharicenans sp.]